MGTKKKHVLPQKTPTAKYITCFACDQNKQQRSFYKSYADDNKTGYVPICKQCIKEKVYRKDGTVDVEALKEILKNPYVDKPFFEKTWQAAKDSKKTEKVGEYFRLIAIPDYQNLGWVNGDRESRVTQAEAHEFNKNTIPSVGTPNAVVDEDEFSIDDIPDFVIKDWGYDYTPKQYVILNETFHRLKEDYILKTGTAIDLLRKYCKNSLLYEESLASRDPKTAKIYNDTMEKILKSDALPKVEEAGGNENFGGLKIKEIEEMEKFIPKFPDLLMDDIDMIILCFVNYIRVLSGTKPFEMGEIKKTSDYRYTKGQEIYFPKEDKECYTDLEMYDGLRKYFVKNPDQFNRMCELVEEEMRPDE